MKKQNLKVFGILAGIGIFLVIILGKPSNNIMSIRYYDENKRLINPTLSTVDNVTNMIFIDLTIKVTNRGASILNCDMIDLQPTVLDEAMARTTQIIPLSNYRSWTSNLINITTLSGLINFNATVRCSYNNGQDVVYLDNQIGGVNINIQ